jgi:hypothetical protein
MNADEPQLSCAGLGVLLEFGQLISLSRDVEQGYIMANNAGVSIGLAGVDIAPCSGFRSHSDVNSGSERQRTVEVPPPGRRV